MKFKDYLNEDQSYIQVLLDDPSLVVKQGSKAPKKLPVGVIKKMKKVFTNTGIDVNVTATSDGFIGEIHTSPDTFDQIKSKSKELKANFKKVFGQKVKLSGTITGKDRTKPI